MKKITPKDCNLIIKSVSIPILNKKEKVEQLYSISEDMALLGWHIDVWDYDYNGFFTAEISDWSECEIINKSMQKTFIQCLCDSINKTLAGS